MLALMSVSDSGANLESTNADFSSQRYINLVAIVNFGFTLQAGWEASGVLMSAAILNGGPATLVYGGIIAAIGSIATAASLGEMASMDPNVGAQYRWSALFARKYKAFWALIQGNFFHS